LSCCRNPPNIYFRRRKGGGVSINSTLPITRMDEKLIFRILQEYKIHNCEVRQQLAGLLAGGLLA
jgi:ribosome-interacting GTPase 1